MSDSQLVVCPVCASINRVPGAKIGAAPNCGRCSMPLFQGQPVDVDQAAFDRHIGRGSLPVLVDFWASWCGPCRAMAPAFKAAAAELEPHVRLLKVDTEAEQGIAGRYGIQSIPTLILFKGGREVTRQAGAMDRGRLVAGQADSCQRLIRVSITLTLSLNDALGRLRARSGAPRIRP